LKGIIFDLKKYAIHDGPGIRTTVFLKGCPLHCWWCHNPESRSMNPQPLVENGATRPPSALFRQNRDIVGREVTVEEVMHEVEKDILYYDESGGGVTFSGGEPLIQPAFLKELLIVSKNTGIHTVVDTCGYIPYEAIETINGWVDLYLYDLKLINESEHIKYTGASNTLIHDNLERLLREGKAVEIRIPLIPDITDTEENIAGTIEYLKSLDASIRLHLLPYNKIGEGKYERFGMTRKLGNLDIQSGQKIASIKYKFQSAGLNLARGES
jgi:pyruvate formate lyase activating enzyme